MAKKAESRHKVSTLRERAYAHIQRKIAVGELPPGRAISEVSLAKEFGMSRSPIREALGQLAAEGILEQSPNRGTVVPRLTRQDIIELYELREALEVYAVGKAASLPPLRADLSKLQALTDAILGLKDELERSGKSELNPEQMQRFVNYDLGTHMLLMRMAANARIQRIVNDTRLLIRIFAMPRRGHTVGLLEDIHSKHSDILRAIKEQDRQRAMSAISEHIRVSMHERLEDFDHHEIDTSLQKYLERPL